MKPVSGYQSFIKNVSFSIVTIILFSICVLPFNVNARSKQPIYRPKSIDSVDGFFNPQIGVCTTVDTECENYSDGECKYKFPTFVKAQVKWEDEGPKICACQVVACEGIAADILKGFTMAGAGFIGGAIIATTTADTDFAGCTINLGCIDLPLAPGPPPFCDQFESSPEIRVVPVVASGQSFFQPKIRVIIGSLAKNLDVSTDGRDLSYTIEYGGERYIFRTYKERDQLCAGFYGNSSKGGNIMLSSQCFPMPKIDKPELIPLDKKGNEIRLGDITTGDLKDLNKVKVKLGYNHNPVMIVYGKGEYDISGLKLKLIKPKVDSGRNFEYYVGCSKGGNFSQDKGCPEGQSIQVGYKEDSNSKVTCLVGWDSDEYVIRRKENSRIFKYLKSSGKQFNDYRIIPIGDKDQYIPCGRTPKDLNIMGQDELDSIKRFSGNYYSLGSSSPMCSDKTLCCRGCLCHDDNILRMVSKGELCKDGKICNANRVVYKYEDTIHKSESFSKDPSNPEYSTKYVNENTGQPFFLTKEELDDKEGNFFRPKDPYISSLCVDNFERISYTDPKEDSNLKKDPGLKDQYHYFDAKKKQCQFVTMEAWGGGAAGLVDEKNPAESISGAAGDYTKATIKVNDEQPIFKIKVGSGGKLEQDNGNGSASEVYMCDKDKKNCDKLITAGGGGNSIKTQDAAIISESLIYTRFIGRANGMSESDKIALPYKNGEEKDKIPYSKSVFKGSLACSSSIKSNKVKKIANDNKIPGSGGCINTNKLSYQEGASGKVIITCEQWD